MKYVKSTFVSPGLKPKNASFLQFLANLFTLVASAGANML